VSFSILATGDVGAKRADLPSMFAGVRDCLRSAPIVFGQLETVVSDRGAMVPNARLAMRAPSALAPALRDAGYTAMSFAGNHCLDWGYDAFADTIAHVSATGIVLAGAGANRAEAYAPVYQQHGDTKVALIAANSILPEGYAATADRPGCAPLHAHTFYEQIEHDQPGTPARVRSHADRADLTSLLDAIRTARAQADVVLVSLHWGIHMVRGVLAEYQPEVAHAAIEAGADAIFGHHPHIMKGIGFHRGKPIFYSLGNFAIEQPHVWDPAITRTASFRHLVSLNPSWSMEASYMLPEETRITGIARLRIADRKLAGVELLPCWIDDDSAPRLVTNGTPEFARVVGYLREVTEAEWLATQIAVEGDLISLSPCGRGREPMQSAEG
jgi:poly-gamma-glutamate capsule biosynthesis protein CapA/YwtB (metallophosphatase superfamily)